MSRTETNPLEHVLRLIAAMAPRPWYPRVYARDYGVSLDDLNDCLKILWNEGLVVKADSGSASTGAGLQLSLSGMRLLDDPEGLRRLGGNRTGGPGRPSAPRRRSEAEEEEGRGLPEALPAGQTAQQVRASLARPVKPIATFVLLGLNVAVFLLGMTLAAREGGTNTASAFFTGADNVLAVAARHTTGSVTVADLQAGQWWRLLSCCFVHVGILQLAILMYVLFSAGRRGERAWGWWRLLVIYLLAGLSGSIVALTQVAEPTVLAGAASALWGILTAELTWLLVNARHLPREAVSSRRSGLFFNITLLTLYTVYGATYQRVSWEGYLAGGVAGAVVAVVLNVQRFGPPIWRWVVLLLLLLLPLGGWQLVERARTQNKVWGATESKAGQTADGKPRTEEEEETDFTDNYIPRIGKAWRGADKDYDKEASTPLERRNPQRRPPKEELDAIIATLEEDRGEMQKLADDLDKAGPYKASKVAEKARVTAAEFLHAYASFFEVAITCLREKKDPKDVPEFAERQRRVDELRARWKKLITRG
jgi:membrane associated rhomboid family serine protease